MPLNLSAAPAVDKIMHVLNIGCTAPAKGAPPYKQYLAGHRGDGHRGTGTERERG